MSLPDFLTGRTSEVLEVLAQSDASTRDAVLRTLIASLRDLKTQAPGESSAQAAEHYGRLLRDFPGAEQGALRTEGLLDASRVLFHCGVPARAAAFAQPALTLARQSGRPDLLAQVANINGVLRQARRDFAGALVLLEEAYRVARDGGLEEVRLRAMVNIATCLQDAGYYGGAIEVNERIVGGSGSTAEPMRRECEAAALGNLVHCHLVRGELSQALLAAERGAERLRQDTFRANPMARHQFESFYNAALLEAGRTEEARRRLLLLREEAPPSSPHTEILFALSQGLCETFAGQTDIGISRLERLLPKAERVGRYVDDVLRALIRAHQEAGDTREALGFIEKLTRHFSTLHTRQLHQQLAHLQQEALGELDPDLRAEVLLAERAADLRLAGLKRTLAEDERTLLENWAVASSLIEDETGRHCFRVGRFSFLMARRLGWSEPRANAIEMAGRLHDIGKIGISNQILLKPSLLSEAERKVVRRHPQIGVQMLSKSSHPDAPLAALVAGSHHEWWDGSGYPSGLRQKAIPVEARIVSLADVYEVLTARRPYRHAHSHAAAVEQLRLMGGNQFDPQLVDTFLDVVEEYHDRHGEGGDDVYQASLRESPVLQSQDNVRRLLAEVD
jgi:HD-GYP domain-containing protein (c-di-GMP phosphodiesterase class II)